MNGFELEDSLPYNLLQKRIAVESITAPSLFEFFSQLLPKSAELVKSFIPGFTKFAESDAPATYRLNNGKRQELLKAVSKVSFTAYEDTLISVPEGFEGHLVAYLEVLLAQSKVVLDHGQAVIKDYNRELAMFLSNLDARSSLKSHAQQYKEIRIEREAYQKAVEAFFKNKNSSLARQKLGSVIERFSDLDKVFQLEEKLINIKKQQDFKIIIAEIQRTVDMMGLVKARIDDKSIETISGQVVKNLSEGAYEVAKYAEYISLYSYFVETALASVSNTADQLSVLFGKH